jgi:phosphoglycerate dehydrogenase-like enzyme
MAGQLATGADVVDVEPLLDGDRLRFAPRTSLTPHIVGMTDSTDPPRGEGGDGRA